MLRTLILFFVLISLFACNSSTPEFYYTKGELKYKYHDIVEDGRVPVIGDYLTVYLEYKTTNGKLIYSSLESTFDGTQVIHLGKPSIEGGIEEGFAQLMEGDSVTFYIEAKKFFENYLNKNLPNEINETDEIQITLRILKVESPNEYEKRMKELDEVCEIKEFMTIDSIVQSWKNDGQSVEEVGGIYLVKGKYEKLDTIKYGNNVSVLYKGYYPNGKEFYNNIETNDPDEFKVGVDGQTIEGLKIALFNMYYGQSATIVVPSYLGFSSQAIESGQVPPCTPLIFELSVLGN